VHGSGENQVTTEPVHLLEQNPQSYIAWTRLTIPQQSDTHLKRERLVDQIHHWIDRKLLLIRAPAGYGKTSLLVELAQETDLEVCWYTIEEQDSDVSVFLTYLVASIARRFPTFGQRTTRILQNLGGQIHTQLRVCASTLADEILNNVPDYFFLILDDYHTLTSDSYVHEFARLLLDFMPEQCHLIISSRTVPPLPLIRLAARQQMAAIGVDELRFSEQEIQQLASKKLGRTVTADQVHSLARHTDGWITAIWLSANMGWEAFLDKNRSMTAGLTETGIYDYLMSEVFGLQPKDVQLFLLYTSVLSEMTLSLCDELLGRDCRDTLHTVEQQNLFISRVEEVGVETGYRYHPLFRDFLQARLREEAGPLYVELNTRAADSHATRQNWRTAIHHNIQAGRFALVRQTVLLHYDELDSAGLKESMVQWIDAIPAEHTSPDLQVRRAQLATELGQIDTALRLYTNALIFYESQGNVSGQCRTLIERSFALSKINRYADAIQDCQQALALLADEEDTDSLSGRAYRYLGRFYGETGDPDSALQFLTLAHECWRRSNEAPVRMARLAQDLGMVYELRGQYMAAIRQYTETLPIWTQLRNDGEVAFVLNSIGVVRHRLGEYKVALEVLREALQKSRDCGAIRSEAYALASLGDLYRDLGQFVQAARYYDQAADRAAIIEEAYLSSYTANARTEILYLTGEVDLAQAEIEHVLSEGTLPKLYEARYRLTLAATYLAQRKSERARQELESVLVSPDVHNDLAFRGHLQLAEAAMLEDHPQETSAHLHTAFQLAQEAGLAQPLSVESVRYKPVLRFVAERMGQTQELTRWLAAAGELEQVRKELGEAEVQVADSTSYPALEVTALGGSAVLMDGTPVVWRTTQAKELFLYLLSHPNGQTKEQIGALLWPDHSAAKLFSIFRSTLFRLRKALFPDAIVFENEQYSLNPRAERGYDAEAFEREISKGEAADNPVQKAYHYRRAVDLYHGPFLADLYADWITPLRDLLQARYLHALTFVAGFYLERQHYTRATEYARRILEVDEYYEIAYYLLIQAYARSGQRPQAKRIFARCRDMLAEFGLSPQKTWEELSR